MKDALKPDEQALVRRVADAIVETVKDCEPDGCPEGPLYAALMGFGLTYDGYEKLVDGLVSVGRLRRAGAHLLRLPDAKK